MSEVKGKVQGLAQDFQPSTPKDMEGFWVV